MPGGSVRGLAACDLFTAELLEVEASMQGGMYGELWISLLCLEGQGGLEWAGGLWI